MNKISSQELAFFSILGTAVNFNLKEEKNSFEVDLKELAEKSDMPENEILVNIKRLEKENYLTILTQEDGKIVLDMSHSENKVNEVFSEDEILRILKDLDYFIKKFNELVLDEEVIGKYIKETKLQLEEDISTDLNEIIVDGIETLFTSETVLIIEKRLYSICEIASRKELEIIEVILFCIYNFKKEENPFYVTLFLASLYKYIR